jgi:hypothetical protein
MFRLIVGGGAGGAFGSSGRTNGGACGCCGAEGGTNLFPGTNSKADALSLLIVLCEDEDEKEGQ